MCGDINEPTGRKAAEVCIRHDSAPSARSNMHVLCIYVMNEDGGQNRADNAKEKIGGRNRSLTFVTIGADSEISNSFLLMLE